MKLKPVLIIALIIFSLCIGIILDRSIKDFPLFKFDGDINILDLVNLLITVGIALMIPLYVSRIIEDARGIKSYIIEELRDFIQVVSGVKKIIEDANGLGSFTPIDRDKINYVFHEAELKAHSIEEQLEVAFGDRGKDISEEIKKALFEYKDYITGGYFSSATCRVSWRPQISPSGY